MRSFPFLLLFHWFLRQPCSLQWFAPPWCHQQPQSREPREDADSSRSKERRNLSLILLSSRDIMCSYVVLLQTPHTFFFLSASVSVFRVS